jgi:hypothetical protein
MYKNIKSKQHSTTFHVTTGTPKKNTKQIREGKPSVLSQLNIIEKLDTI